MRIAVFFVGNRLMLDDGIGPAVYDYIVENYNFGNETSANEVLANVWQPQKQQLHLWSNLRSICSMLAA